MEQQGETGTITMQTFGGLPGPTAWTPEGATVLFDPRFLFSPEELLDTYYDAMTYDDDEECLGLPHEHLFLLCRCRSRRAASSARPAGEEEEEDRVGYGLDSTAVAAVDYEDNLEALGFFDFVRTLRKAFEALGEGEENYDADVEEAYCEVQAGRSKRRTSKSPRRARRWEKKKKKNSMPATGGISSS